MARTLSASPKTLPVLQTKTLKDEAEFWDTHSPFEFPESSHPVGGIEGRVYRLLRRRYPAKDGWRILFMPGDPATAKIPDFVVERGSDKVVIEIKGTRRLTPGSVVQTAAYAKAVGASQVFLFTWAQPPRGVLELARRSDVTIRVLRSRRKLKSVLDA